MHCRTMLNYGVTWVGQKLNHFAVHLKVISRLRVEQYTNYNVCLSHTDLTRTMVSMYQVVVRKRSNR